MADDVNKQKEKREKYSRRRRHDPDADIDYINERNMKFNQKLERFVIRLFFFCRVVLPSVG
jgi:pre-mRNA-splicing factor SYF2